uniref:DUF4283 domain-containing protein n=1 Tax=Setaria viridis TaxID=4556 RepID=A0A4U6W5G5_SETVI|nr:hypothetical protein SEVIR_1G042300v2 [Setaria viridis]
MPWEFIAPCCGLAASELGFHIIQDDDYGDATKDMAYCALMTIKEGEVTARQVEGEFKTQAGPTSTWRWYAKKVAENKFQMKFPTAKKVEELSFFIGMQMRMVPNISFKVEQWNPHAGAKAEISSAWFRIFGIPLEKKDRKEDLICWLSFGIPLEVDKINSKRWHYVRVGIGCKDVTKILATREVPIDGATNPAGNTWTRTVDRPNDNNPSPKKPKRGEGGNFPKSGGGNLQYEAGTSQQQQGYQHATNMEDENLTDMERVG